MLARTVLSSAIVVGVLVSAGTGAAQTQQAPPPAAGQPGDAPAPSGGAGPATEGGERKASSVPAAGYAYGDRASASRSTTHAHYRQRGPVVSLPGFEQTGDGGSRLFVQLSQQVPVEERKAPGSITYVLKGASPRVWNNTNALVTVHFNTPVSRARLVPQGQDLLFIVELRSAATPTWKMTEGTDKSAMLTIDFPKGDFSQAADQPAASEPEPAPAAKPARKPGTRKPAPAKRAPSPAPAPKP